MMDITYYSNLVDVDKTMLENQVTTESTGIQNVCQSVAHCCQQCIAAGGGHFKDL
jgi:hypothetical protein